MIRSLARGSTAAFALCFGLLLPMTPVTAENHEEKPAATTISAGPQKTAKKPGATADHTKFEILQKPFASGPEVTQACLSCHTEAAKQVHKSIHWTWDYTHPKTGQKLGKKNVINAFCGNIASNEPRCTSCHVGYGWKDNSFDFTSEQNVDCLACHDTTGDYVKWPTNAGHPLYEPLTKNGKTFMPPDLTKIAQKVGMPGRANCGACHFNGGGGDAVKHGDLDSSLTHPTKALDVHMAEDGPNFACSACHVSDQHIWPGSRYDTLAKDTGGTGKPGQRRDVASCESCHSDQPHKGVNLEAIKLNGHTDKVACQTCHIPAFARGGVATKTYWDWSTAGKLKDGKPYSEENEKGLHTYMSIKGTFEWEENVTPYYAWFDGQVQYTTADETIDPENVVEINKIAGNATDGKSRIWPFKKMRGRQAYDAGTNHLVYNHVFGKDDTALWTNLDWEKAIAAGQKAVGREFSGKYGFVDTAMYWPITHMVAPKEDALKCGECHAKDGRLAGVTGVYMPGRDSYRWLDLIGYTLFGLTLLGIFIHGILRFAMRKRTR
ncbi:MAG: cytochrome C [Hyphomicrobiales bacterium]|nr:MAG: cytochrome C [Hyphomicrobiales bacterium]